MENKKRNEKEIYETPAVLDISPVSTVVCEGVESVFNEDPAIFNS